MAQQPCWAIYRRYFLVENRLFFLRGRWLNSKIWAMYFYPGAGLSIAPKSITFAAITKGTARCSSLRMVVDGCKGFCGWLRKKKATSRDYTSTPRPPKDMAMAQNYQAPKWMVFLLNMIRGKNRWLNSTKSRWHRTLLYLYAPATGRLSKIGTNFLPFRRYFKNPR